MNRDRFLCRIMIAALCLVTAAPAAAVDPDGKFILVIDPGHGGKDPGAVNGKNQEKTINLNIALNSVKIHDIAVKS